MSDEPELNPLIQRMMPYFNGLQRMCEGGEPVAACLVVYLPEEDENAVKPHVVSFTPTTDDMKLVEASVRRLHAVAKAHLGVSGPRAHIRRSPSKEDDRE